MGYFSKLQNNRQLINIFITTQWVDLAQGKVKNRVTALAIQSAPALQSKLLVPMALSFILEAYYPSELLD